MSESEKSSKPAVLLEEITEFIRRSSGLKLTSSKGNRVSILQEIDGKNFSFSTNDLSEVLQRSDSDGKPFIQVNFVNGHKVLFTSTLVGFKPRETYGLDMTKIPRVVTTPDLVSVFAAIEEGLSSDDVSEYEIDVLKRVYAAIIQGGEAAGFDLQFERRWLGRLMPSKTKVSA